MLCNEDCSASWVCTSKEKLGVRDKGSGLRDKKVMAFRPRSLTPSPRSLIYFAFSSRRIGSLLALFTSESSVIKDWTSSTGTEPFLMMSLLK